MGTQTDGHALNVVLRHMELNAVIVCPFEGQEYVSTLAAPQCRLQQENGDPGVGPYLADTCAVASQFNEQGGRECIDVPEGKTFEVKTLPVPIDWHLVPCERKPGVYPSELWITPLATEATS